MKIIKTIDEIKSEIKKIKTDNKKLGFVPTMGALHEGHLSLVKEAEKRSDIVVVSIFVNPTQFGENEDLDKYPRDIEGDKRKLEKLGVDIIFFPDVDEMYPDDFQTTVSVKQVSKGLCGDKRPGHFDGVATVVLKLFNIVKPDFAFFGLKDYQQFKLISQMVKDLNLDIEIVGIEIVREEDGLAMSSRNLNLTPEGRKKAALIYKNITKAISFYQNGEKNFNESDFIVKYLTNELEKNGFIIDYIEIRNKDTLKEVDKVDDDAMIFIATFLEGVRLIDNYLFGDGNV